MLAELLSERATLTIADMEAGLEHLSRSDGTLRHIDQLLVVIEPYRKAIETARRTLALATELGISKIYGVANKVEDEADADAVREFADELGLEILVTVPYDERARRADKKGLALIEAAPESEAVAAIGELLDRLEALWEPEPVSS